MTFEDRVMQAAGVQPTYGDTFCECGHSYRTHRVEPPGSMTGSCWRCHCPKLRPVERNKFYPKPLTDGGFVALWDALQAQKWGVAFHPISAGKTRVNVWRLGQDNIADNSCRKVALLEAAAAALEVSRDA